jgi:hypothetical protein
VPGANVRPFPSEQLKESRDETLSLRVLSLSLLSVAGFTDNSDNNGSEYAGLRVKDGAWGVRAELSDGWWFFNKDR